MTASDSTRGRKFNSRIGNEFLVMRSPSLEDCRLSGKQAWKNADAKSLVP